MTSHHSIYTQEKLCMRCGVPFYDQLFYNSVTFAIMDDRINPPVSASVKKAGEGVDSLQICQDVIDPLSYYPYRPNFGMRGLTFFITLRYH